MMSLAGKFAVCKLIPNAELPFSTIKRGKNGSCEATAFFMDSSGHSTFILPLDLNFASQEDLDLFLASKTISPSPTNQVKNNLDESESGDMVDDSEKPASEDDEMGGENDDCDVSLIGFEARCSSSNDDMGKNVVVEAINVLATSVKGRCVTFEVEVTVRATNANTRNRQPEKLDGDSSILYVDIEVTPVFTVKKNAGSAGTLHYTALELGAIPDQMLRESSSSRIKETRLDPISVRLALSQAFVISVNSVSGTTTGTTLISLSIRHSNLHREPVVINNIAIHPGSSRYENFGPERGSFASKYSVTNMTNAVQWKYAPQTELLLPLTLNPYEGCATVLVMTGGEDMHSRRFMSPVSVTGVVGPVPSSRCRVVVAAAARWSTEVVAIEPADAFRVEMKVPASEVKLGEEMVVSLQIFNLSLEPRNLMLLTEKAESEGVSSEQAEIVNSAVVSEISGYTFGVWGITGGDDGTTPHSRDHSLLAVDGALMLGNVLGQHAVDAELRFVALRRGLLKVPNWRLFDKSSGKWYSCAHKLVVVAT